MTTECLSDARLWILPEILKTLVEELANVSDVRQRLLDAARVVFTNLYNIRTSRSTA
jgi:hypothetical protein